MSMSRCRNRSRSPRRRRCRSWDMIEALRCRNAHRGIVPSTCPASGRTNAATGWVFGLRGRAGRRAVGRPARVDDRRGRGGRPGGGEYKEFCENLNLRFLTTLMQDPSDARAEVRRRWQRSTLCSESSSRARRNGRCTNRRSEGVCCSGSSRRRRIIAKNPQLQYRQWLTPVEHPDLGATLEYPGAPYRLSETPWAIHRRPPEAGQHTRELKLEAEVEANRRETA